MNSANTLFLSAYDDFLADVINTSFHQSDEVRIISQSMMPSHVWDIFSHLDEKYPNLANLKTYLKVAFGLIKYWQTLKLDDHEKEAFANLQKNNWLDNEDKLTWYRNRTTLDEKTDKLLIFLVGLDYTTDKGGLADFFVLNDDKVWLFLGNNYKTWLNRIFDDLGMIQGSQSIGLLNEYLQQINKVVPMSLSQKSQFLYDWITQVDSNANAHMLLATLLKSLPKLGIPYLDIEHEAKLFSTKKGIDFLKNASEFISHVWYKSNAKKKSHFEKADKYFKENSDTEIKAIDGSLITPTDYLKIIQEFIFNADKTAKQQLTNIDLLPLLKALKIKEEKEKTPTQTIPMYHGQSIEAVLKGLHNAIFRYKKENEFDKVISISVKVTHFQHDFANDKEQNQTKDSLANQRLLGTLGGIENFVSRIQIDNETPIHFVPLSSDGIPNYQLRASNTNPQVTFEVIIDDGEEETKRYPFRWQFSEYQMERLHIQFAEVLLDKLNNTPTVLPAFTLNADIFKAIYYASNQEEACRLLSLGMNSLQVHDVFDHYNLANFPDLQQKISRLKIQFEHLLQQVVTEGQYYAQIQISELSQAYLEVYEAIKQLDKQSSHDIAERFYYAFFMLNEMDHFSLSHVEHVLAMGFHPATYELITAQTYYVLKAFSDIYLDNTVSYQKIDDIFIQSAIESPVLAIRQKHNSITTHHKSFGWLHFIGQKPKGDIDLYVQSLLQEAETEYEDDVQQVFTAVPEQKIIVNVLDDYQKVNNHANDGLRILATHVTQLPALLQGLTDYYHDILLPEDLVGDVYTLYLSVHTFDLSKLASVNTLKTWQDNLIDMFAKRNRILKLKISHYASNTEALNTYLKNHIENQQITQLGRYDLVFSFNFLQDKAEGKTVSAPSFIQGNSINNTPDNRQIFPIIYYPKPIFQQNSDIRELRLSQRQIKIQSCHANLTAHLQISDRIEAEQYFVLSRMDYDAHDIEMVERLHQVASWVVTIDEYFDHYLLKKNNALAPAQERKVISFSSGYGNYGELNVTLSTAHQAFAQLKRNVQRHLMGIMPFLHQATLENLADEILRLNEGLSGVANIQSILGEDETIRNLYGYALSIKQLPFVENSVIHEWIPLDAYRHWFNEIDNRPDLLQLSLTVGQNNKPTLHACVVEAKVGLSDLLTKAKVQVASGLNHLKQLFAPKSNADVYDRRYWWGQLYRALIARATVSQLQSNELDIALEKLAEGDFEIIWTMKIVICKTGFAEEQINITYPPLIGYENLAENEQQVEVHEISEASFEKILLDNINWTTVPKNTPVVNKNAKTDGVAELIATPTTSSDTIISTSTAIADNTTQKIASENQAISDNTDTLPMPSPVINPVNPSDQSSHNIADDKPANEVESNTDGNIEPNEPSSTIDFVEPSAPLVENASPIVQIVPITQGTQPELEQKDILIGTTGSRNEPVTWAYNHKGLNNRHMLIFGSSGSGKTYAIQAILSELANAGLSSVIIDYTDGFLSHQSQPVYKKITKPAEYFVRIKPLPINPFKRYSAEITPGMVIEEEPFYVALRVKNILSSVFTDFGSQQIAIIDKVLTEGLTDEPNYRLEHFLDDLEDNGVRGESIANKIRSLIKLNAFDTAAMNNIYEDEMRQQHAVQIIQLTQIPKDLQRIITEFVLWDLWAYVQKYGNKDKPITIVLDEMQNLDHRADSPIDKLLREGRKFGVSLILATQTISNFNQEQKDRLFQASTKLFFKPATTEVVNFADLLTKVYPTLSKTEWVSQLNSLDKGQCFFIGYAENTKGEFKETVAKVDVTALENRFSDKI